jgi:hypothetical protein
VFVFLAGLRHVPDRQVGIVYRRFGLRHPQDTSRVSLYGSVGPQAEVLRHNTRQWLMPVLFDVVCVPQTRVPDGTIGLVQAKDGKVRPSGRRLGLHVECDYFQDGAAFLRLGGEQGRQLGYLPGGAYYSINTELFDVITTETVDEGRQDGLTAADLAEFAVVEGDVGVVIALDGAPPNPDPDVVGRVVAGHSGYRYPWVFLAGGGQRGVQEETLPGGSSYAINPWFARVVQIPTRDLILEWTNRSLKDVGNFDAALDQIVVDIQGHRLSLEMSQVLRIPASAAPRLVRRFGEGELDPIGSVVKPVPVRRFVERVLGAAVAGYFTEIVAEYQVMQFIRQYNKVRMDLQDRVTQALADWDVVAGGTILAEFTSEDRELNELRRALTRQDIQLTQEERRRKFLEEQRQNQAIEAQMERIKIDLKGEGEVVVLRKQIEAIGQHNWLMDRLLEHMAKMQVPTVIGGDIADQILKLMPFVNAQDMLKELFRNGMDDAKPVTANGDKKPRRMSVTVSSEEPETDQP